MQNILCLLLCDGPASFFSKSLLDKNIGSQYAPSTGYDFSNCHSYGEVCVSMCCIGTLLVRSFSTKVHLLCSISM